MLEITKAFEIINSKLEEELLKKGFEKRSVAPNDKEITALYIGSIAYSVVYYIDKMRVVLRTCGVEENEPDNSWKTIATWLFDPEADSVKEAENIGEDFAETVRGPKQLAVQKQKRGRRDGEASSDPLFFANRMVAYFPELRDEIAYEKAHYSSFRGVTFAEEKIKPKFRDYVNGAGNKALIKLSKNLASLYDSGDLEVKGIITYILLNSIDDEKYETITSEFEKDLKKTAAASRKLRGKKIKPEKPKKPKKYIAENLNGTR